MRRLVRFAVASLLCGVLAACGFHLRSDAALPSGLQPIFIGGAHGNGALGQALRYQLNNANTRVTPRSADANYQLLLLDESEERRIISLDRRGLAAEYGLTWTIRFELQDKAGNRVLGPQTIEERRTITNNPDNALTTSQDLGIVRADMYQTLAAQVVRRLGAYAKHAPAQAQAPQPAG